MLVLVGCHQCQTRRSRNNSSPIVKVFRVLENFSSRHESLRQHKPYSTWWSGGYNIPKQFVLWNYNFCLYTVVNNVHISVTIICTVEVVIIWLYYNRASGNVNPRWSSMLLQIKVSCLCGLQATSRCFVDCLIQYNTTRLLFGTTSTGN